MTIPDERVNYAADKVDTGQQAGRVWRQIQTRVRSPHEGRAAGGRAELNAAIGEPLRYPTNNE
jgi:hypothetical protein